MLFLVLNIRKSRFSSFVIISEVNIITGVGVFLFTSTTQIYKMTYLRLWLKINMARHLTLGVQLFSEALCSLIVSEPTYVEYNCVSTRKTLDAKKVDEATGDFIGK